MTFGRCWSKSYRKDSLELSLFLSMSRILRLKRCKIRKSSNLEGSLQNKQVIVEPASIQPGTSTPQFAIKARIFPEKQLQAHLLCSPASGAHVGCKLAISEIRTCFFFNDLGMFLATLALTPDHPPPLRFRSSACTYKLVHKYVLYISPTAFQREFTCKIGVDTAATVPLKIWR